MKLLTLALLMISGLAFAGESGFVYQGKSHVVFKDGKKVGKTFEEMFGADRKPDSVDALYSLLTFEEDETAGVRCYRDKIRKKDGFSLSCVKIK